MAAGGHFGFWPLLGLAHTFCEGHRGSIFLNTSKYPNPLSNLPLLSVVTGGPNMTVLLRPKQMHDLAVTRRSHHP